MVAYTSQASGDWSNAGTWLPGGGPPIAGDTATIAGTHIVEIDGDTTVGTSPNNQTTFVVTVQNRGTLRWKAPPTGDWTFEVRGNMKIDAGGTFQIGKSSSPIPNTRTATLYFPSNLSSTHHWRLNNDGDVVIHGAPDYRQTSGVLRARLVGNVTANPGTPVAFQTNISTGWQMGDTVWVGTGASPTTAPTACEQIVIATAPGATSYTADFANDHVAGDVVVHDSGNVLIRGGSASPLKGLTLYSTSSTTLTAANIKYDIRWARFLYCATSTTDSRSAIYFACSPSTITNAHFDPNNFVLEGCIFSDPATTATPGKVLYFQCTLDLEDQHTMMDNCHCWDHYTLVELASNVKGRPVIHDCSAIEMFDAGILAESSNLGLYVDGFIYVSDSTWSGSGRIGIEGWVRSVVNTEIHRGYHGISITDSGVQTTPELMLFRNVKIYNAYYSAVTHPDARRVSMMFDTCEIYNNRQNGLQFSGTHGRIEILNSSFDDCGNAASNKGAVYMTGKPRLLRFHTCTFGLNDRNNNNNVHIGGTQLGTGDYRIIAENCTFKEPANWVAGSYRWATDVHKWALSLGGESSAGDWRTRMDQTPNVSAEYVDCGVLDYSDVDQWPVQYPNVTRLAVGAGGGEIRNETTEIIDNTFPAVKLLPFGPAIDFITRHRSILLPLTAGQTLTVTLSMKKTADGLAYLPGIFLEGLGINDESRMTAALLNTWEELSVTGTAQWTGVAEFYISGGSNVNDPSVTFGDDYYSPPDPTVPADWDTMFGCKVYADGFSITVT